MLTMELTISQAIYHNQIAKAHSKVNVVEVISLIQMTYNKHFLCDGYSLSNLVLPENTCRGRNSGKFLKSFVLRKNKITTSLDDRAIGLSDARYCT